jgi:hypothetical protein
MINTSKLIISILCLFSFFQLYAEKFGGNLVITQKSHADHYTYEPMKDWAYHYTFRINGIHYIYNCNMTIVNETSGHTYTAEHSLNGVFYNSGENLVLPESWMEDLFETIKNRIGLNVSNFEPAPGSYRISVQFSGSDPEFIYYTNVAEVFFIIPEKHISNFNLDLNNSGFAIYNLNDLQKYLRLNIFANYRYDYRLYLTSLNGWGNNVCTPSAKFMDISWENEKVMNVIQGESEWLDLLGNNNLSCSASPSPYELLQPGDYVVCVELRNSAGNSLNPKQTDCLRFTVEEHQFTVNVNSAPIEICKVTDIALKLVGLVSFESTVNLSEGYAISAELSSTENSYQCKSNKFWINSATSPYLLNLTDLNDLMGTMVCLGEETGSYSSCIPPAKYTLRFKLHKPGALPDDPPIGFTALSMPTCEVIVEKEDLEFEINTTLNTIDPVNVNALMASGAVGVQMSVNVPVSNIYLHAKLTGNGISLTSVEGIEKQQDFPFSITVTPADIRALLEESNTNLSGPANKENVYSGILPAGNYQLCFELRDFNNKTITSTGNNCVSFTVEEVEPEIFIDIFGNPGEVCSLSDFYRYNNMVVQMTGNVPYTGYRLFANVNGGRVNCGTSSQRYFEIPQTDPPNYLSRVTDLEELLGEGNTSCTPNIYQNCFEAGTYQLCFSLQDAEGQTVAWAGGSNPCFDFEVYSDQIYTLLSPPEIIFPVDGERIESLSGFQNIVFNWLPDQMAPERITYTLKIVELPDTNLNPSMAMLTATTPSFFEEEIDAGTSVYHYGMSDPELVEGRFYAFQVIAKDPNGQLKFENNGASRIHYFKYGYPERETDDFEIGDLFTETEIPDKVFYNRKVSGSYRYHFKNRTERPPLGNTNVMLKVAYLHFPKAASINDIQSQYRLSNWNSISGWTDVSGQFPDGSRVLDNSVTDSRGNFTLYATALSEEGLPDFGYHRNLRDRTGKTLTGIVLKCAVVNHTNPYFLNDRKFAVLHEDPVNMPLEANPKTYNAEFRFVCSGTIANAPASYQNIEKKPAIGTPIGHYNAYLLRAYSPVGLPVDEGSRKKFTEGFKDGKTIVCKAKTDANGKVIFKDLMISRSDLDKYYVYLEPDDNDPSNYKFQSQSFLFRGNPDYMLGASTQTNIKNNSAVYNDEYTPVTVMRFFTADIGMREVFGKVMAENSASGAPGIIGANVYANFVSEQSLSLMLSNYLSPGASFIGRGDLHKTTYPDGMYGMGILPRITDKKVTDFNLLLTATKFGYSNNYEYATVKGLRVNERKRVDLMLYPNGKIKGILKLADRGGIDGYIGQKDQLLSRANRDGSFDIQVPSGDIVLQAEPPQSLAAHYFTVFKELGAKASRTTSQDIGTIELPKRQHSLKIMVARDQTDPPLGIAGAKVKIKFKDNLEFTTDNKGVVHCQFKASSVEDLQILVESPEDQDFEPVLWINDGTVSDLESREEVTVLIRMKRAGRVSGRVTYGQGENQKPVDSARVSIGLGNNVNLIAFTNSNGEYELRNVPLNRKLEIVAAKGRSQFVGDKELLYMPNSPIENFNFNLTVYNGMDITELLHLPIEVHDLSLTSTGARIEAVYYDFSSLIPEGWKIDDDKLMVRFITEIIPSKTDFNDDGVPRSLPKSGKILTDKTSLDWKYQNKVYYIQYPNGDFITIENDGTGWARVQGKMKLVMVQYNLNSSELGLEKDGVYIGNGTKKTAAERIAFTTIGKRATASFNIMDQDGNNLNYLLYGFKATAEPLSSLVKEDRTLLLDTRLHTDLENVHERQKDLKIKIGVIEAGQDAIGEIEGKTGFEFGLGYWNLNVIKWKLGAGGISADSCILKTPYKDMPIDDFYITFNKLGAGLPKINMGDLIISETVPIEVAGNTYFKYNNSKNSWCIDVRADYGTANATGTQAAAAFVKDLNVFDPDDRLITTTFTLFANNTTDVHLRGGQKVRVYNVASYEPSEMVIMKDGLSFKGAIGMEIPGLGSSTNALRIVKGTTKRAYKKKDLYESMVKIEPVFGKLNANSVNVELVTTGQKFAPNVFGSDIKVTPTGASAPFMADLTKKANAINCALRAGQNFEVCEGKMLNQLEGSLSGFVNPLNKLNLSQEQIGELNHLAGNAKLLDVAVNALDIPYDLKNKLISSAGVDPAKFNSLLGNLDKIQQSKIEELKSLGSGLQQYGEKIGAFNIEEDAKKFLIGQAGKMGSISQSAWGDMNLGGKLEGMTGAASDMDFVVNSEWIANEQNIGVENVPTSFGGVGLTYNLEKKRLEGHVSFEQDFGTAVVEADASIVIGASGWYFIATGKFELDAMDIEGLAGIMFGDHEMEDEMDEMFKEVSFYYQKLGKMPSSYPDRLKGFFFEAGAAFPVPVPGYFKANFAVAKVEFVVRVGGDTRMGMTFGKDVTTYSIGQGIFIEAWLEASAGFIACVEISLEASVGMDISGEYSTNGQWWAEGVGWVTVEGSITVGGGGCVGGCGGKLCFKDSKSGSLTATVTARFGTDYKKLSIAKKTN